MKRLVDLVKIVENNKECVILEVTGSMLDLIKLGCFDGDETLIRLTKGGNHTCTIWKKDGNYYSWWWGISGCTMVTEKMSKRGRLIEECLTQDFEICMEGDDEKTLHIKSLDDVKHISHKIEMMYWAKGREVRCRRDGSFYKSFKNVEEAKEHFREYGYSVNLKKSYTASTGCVVEEYFIER